MIDLKTAAGSESPADGRTAAIVDIESAAFLETVLNASGDCIKVLSLDGELLFMNNGGIEIMEIDDFESIRGCAWASFWEGENQQAAIEAISLAKAGATGRFVGQAETLRGSNRWWDVTVTPIFGSGGAEATHLLSISRDITVTRTAQLQRDLLSEELNHRVKNLLAVVGAIASQTFAMAESDNMSMFNSRLQALGEAQSLLMQTAWQSAPMTQILTRALLPHALGDRIRLSGPELTLSAKEGLALALAIHELATNAVKYGSLSNMSGVVDVAWSIADGKLTFAWVESGGPDVEAPTRNGFGTRIIKRNLAGEFRGDVTVNYYREGLSLKLVADR